MHRARAMLFTLYTPLKLAGAENTSIRPVSLKISKFPFLTSLVIFSSYY